MTTVINWIDVDWAEHQEHLKNDPEHEPFYNNLYRDYVNGIKLKWASFLATPMFEVKMEIPGAPQSSVHRTVARVMEHVQAIECMPPLNPADHDMHRKV